MAKAEHDFFTCQYFVAPQRLTVRLCSWEPSLYEREMVAATLQAVLAGIPDAPNLNLTVVVVSRGILHDDIYGMFEPASKVILLSPNPELRFYYSLGHEVIHAFMDQQHISWDDQHCIMGTTAVLTPLRNLLRSWNPEYQVDDVLRLITQCRGSE